MYGMHSKTGHHLKVVNKICEPSCQITMFITLNFVIYFISGYHGYCDILVLSLII